jgi:hypothetical protein
MSLQDSLKLIRARHSYLEIHTELLSMMRSEYDELHSLFGSSPSTRIKPQQTQVIQEPQKADDTQEDTQGQEQEQEQSKLVIVNKQKEGETDSKMMKKWQKEQEQKKLVELQAAGIVPESLLTVENLRQWVEKEGKTYAYVARIYLGLPESRVSEFGKKNGVLSQMSKKRAVLAAKATVKRIAS